MKWKSEDKIMQIICSVK